MGGPDGAQAQTIFFGQCLDLDPMYLDRDDSGDFGMSALPSCPRASLPFLAGVMRAEGFSCS